MACAPATYATPYPQAQAPDEDQTQPQTSDPWANNQAPGAQQPYQQPDQQQMDTYEYSASSGPRLGIMVTGLTPELRQFYGAPRERGVLVARVVPGSPAARAGLHVGDIIVSLNGQSVSASGDILSLLSNLDRTQAFPLTIVRDRRVMSIRAQLSPAPPQPAEGASAPSC